MATPRTTRARSKTPAPLPAPRTPAPLPAISTKPSAAYGARGKANLGAQVASGSSDFASAFKPTRDPQLEDDTADDGNETDIVPPKSAAKRGKRKTRATAERTILEDPQEEASGEVEPTVVEGRSGTNLDSGAGYMIQAEPQPPPPSPPPPPAGYRLPEAIVFERVSRFRVFMRALPRYIVQLGRNANPTVKDLIYICSILIVSFTIMLWMPMTPNMMAAREGFIFHTKRLFGIHPYDLPPTEMEMHWHQFKHDLLFSKDFPDHNVPEMQWAININIYERLERIEAHIKLLEGNMTLQQETMDTLHEMLPPRLIVHVKDGQYEIPEPFWQALQARLTGDHDIGPLWDSYMAHNNREIEHLTQLLVKANVDRVLEERKVIDRAAFLKAIQDNNDHLAFQYRDQFHEMQKQNFAEVKDLALHTSQQFMRESLASTLTQQQLMMLIKAHEIHTSYEALRTINWFSVGLGARIDPGLTSATQQPPQSQGWLQRTYRAISPNFLQPHPPITAIRRWDEATDCWCAARDDTGTSQITIITATKIHPTKFVIEHMPKTGTPNIDAAPRDYEIWAHVPSARAARKFEAEMDSHMKFFEIGCGARPSPSSVCIAKGKYDIHRDNYVQTQNTFVDSKSLGLVANKFTVKVLSNWGAEWTCLYRVRGLGEKVGNETVRV